MFANANNHPAGALKTYICLSAAPFVHLSVHLKYYWNNPEKQQRQNTCLHFEGI